MAWMDGRGLSSLSYPVPSCTNTGSLYPKISGATLVELGGVRNEAHPTKLQLAASPESVLCPQSSPSCGR